MSKLIKIIISEQLLTEGRRENAIELWVSRVGGVPSEQTINAIGSLVDGISENDPSGNNKYLEWMVGLASIGKVSLSDMYETVKKYHENLNKITKPFMESLRDIVMASAIVDEKWIPVLNNPKDINSFQDLDSLKNFVYYLGGYKSRSQLKKDEAKLAKVVKVFDDDEVLVVSPKSQQASCKYGAGTKWCTTSRIENHFDYYASKGVLFYIIPKKSDSKLAIFISFNQLGGRIVNFDVYDEQDNHLDFDSILQAVTFGVDFPYIENGEYKRPSTEKIRSITNAIIDHYLSASAGKNTITKRQMMDN